MNRALIDKWNQVVGPKDEVWFLGDFGFHPAGVDSDELPWIFAALHGRKHLVVGNHDAKNKQVLRLAWGELEDLKDIKVAKQRITLCHYPLTTWPASHYGSIQLHGHCHGTLQDKRPKRFDVGVDVEPFPISLEQVVERAAAEPFVPIDAHGSAPTPEGWAQGEEEDGD